jgi:hypothetical protein
MNTAVSRRLHTQRVAPQRAKLYDGPTARAPVSGEKSTADSCRWDAGACTMEGNITRAERSHSTRRQSLSHKYENTSVSMDTAPSPAPNSCSIHMNLPAARIPGHGHVGLHAAYPNALRAMAQQTDQRRNGQRGPWRKLRVLEAGLWRRYSRETT